LLKIMSPGMPNIQPWKIGIRPPISPMMTRMMPNVILNVCLIIKKGVRRKTLMFILTGLMNKDFLYAPGMTHSKRPTLMPPSQ